MIQRIDKETGHVVSSLCPRCEAGTCPELEHQQAESAYDEPQQLVFPFRWQTYPSEETRHEK
jgi:hypothetical protein